MNVYRAARAILLAGLICGVLDGLSAAALFGYLGVPPMRLFQGIAAGALGKRAQQGGAATALAGVALHFTVALGAAAVYYAASRQFPLLIERALACGVLYGIAVHLFMSFVVIPLSAIGPRPLVVKTFVSVLIVHMLVVGPSISLSIRRWG